jgi:hypothetical protein
MTEILEKAGEYRVRLEVQQDQQDSNPRRDRDCNLANVITLAGQRYIDVDENGGPLQDGWNHFADRDHGIDLFTRWAKMAHGATVVEENPHDGARSLWYVMPEKIAEAGTPVSPEQIIAEEVKEYQAWASGEVYGYVIEKAVGWSRLDSKVDIRVTWEEEESCWGFIGREYAEASAREAFAPYAKEAQA